MNYIEYEVYIEKFGIIGEVKVNSSFRGIREISVIQVSDKKDTIIRFVLEESIANIDDAKEYCEIALNEIMNVFSWHTCGQVGLPKQEAHSFGGVTSTYSGLPGSLKIPTAEKKLNQIKADIENPKGDNDYLRLYRFAFLNEDNVSKFLILYSILYLLKRNQKKVDNYIISKESSVEKKPSTKDPSEDETIYTYLRNQIGHIQPDSDGKYVRAKIQSVLDKFTEIVKAAIDEETQQP